MLFISTFTTFFLFFGALLPSLHTLCSQICLQLLLNIFSYTLPLLAPFFHHYHHHHHHLLILSNIILSSVIIFKMASKCPENVFILKAEYFYVNEFSFPTKIYKSMNFILNWTKLLNCIMDKYFHFSGIILILRINITHLHNPSGKEYGIYTFSK